MCAEQQIVLESSTMRDAVLDLVASYFVFDISYPKSLSAILIFIQHEIFGMGDSQSIPIAAAKLMGNIKLTVEFCKALLHLFKQSLT